MTPALDGPLNKATDVNHEDLVEPLPPGEITVISDRELNRLLDRLATVPRREDQVDVMRSWTDEILRTWSDEHSADELEVLGKLGGG